MFFSKSNRWRTENKQKRSSIVLTWVSYKNNLDTSGWKQVFCYRSWLFPAVLHASNFFQMCSHLNILLNPIAAPWSPYFLLKSIYLSLTPCHALGIRRGAKIMWFPHARNDGPTVCQLVPSAVPGAVSGRLWQLNCRLQVLKNRQ